MVTGPQKAVSNDRLFLRWGNDVKRLPVFQVLVPPFADFSMTLLRRSEANYNEEGHYQ